MKRRVWPALVVITAASWGVVGCGTATDHWLDEPGSPRIVVTIAPLASLVRGVAGDGPAVRCLCTTTGPHHYTLDTRDARLLQKADLFLAVGLRLDDNFADAMRAQARRPDLPYIKLGGLLPPKSLLEMKHDHDHAHGDGDHAHVHGKWDPHVWLGVPEMSAMAEAVRDQLIKMNPDQADTYKKNTEEYTAKLKALHADGKKMLEGKKNRRVISFHEALNYFARSFDLEIADVIEPGPGDEPSPRHLATIVQLCRDEKRPIAAITVEPQYPKTTSAAVLNRELKGKVPLVEIDPLETADPEELRKEGAGWYEARMRKNLEALASKLP
jgi:ABC-type Zn uptake system ZnuABC Zn-binding protein ZnuA